MKPLAALRENGSADEISRGDSDLLNQYYPESRFGGFSDVDGTMIFYQRVQGLLRPSDVALDVGCGRGVNASDSVPVRRQLGCLSGKCKWVIGIDVDSVGRNNPLVDEFRLIEDAGWPVHDESVDLCLADWVLEHIADPLAFFSELRRVLRPGGHFCARTTNRLGYVALASRLIPKRSHNKVLAHTCASRTDGDFFPILHRCNTRRSLRRLLGERGFDFMVYGYEAEPSYLEFSSAAYALGVMWQRWSPEWLRNTIFVFAKKGR